MVKLKINITIKRSLRKQIIVLMSKDNTEAILN